MLSTFSLFVCFFSLNLDNLLFVSEVEEEEKKQFLNVEKVRKRLFFHFFVAEYSFNV